MNTAYHPLIFDLSKPGRCGFRVPRFFGSPNHTLPSELLRSEAPQLPEVDEPTAVRHYTRLSNGNFGVDTGFYPLGSCTMKYNPKINEEMASHHGFVNLHPSQPYATVQGALKAYHMLAQYLCEIGGMAEFTLNPFAGAHGELTGLMVIKAYHESRGDLQRNTVIVPNSAHGTNPASAAVAGYKIGEVNSLPDGTVDLDDLQAHLTPNVAAVMLTNPNTTGMFEKNIPQIAHAVHQAGALLYYDGANLNPLLGVARPGDMGFDVMHINLHKTFATPHGGGGPGAGPVGVRKGLEQFLPLPKVVVENGVYTVLTHHDQAPGALGQISSWLGNYTVLLKALTYILMMGSEGLMKVGPLATLAANYVKESLKDLYRLPIEGLCMHEFVFDGLRDKSTHVTTLDVAKRLLDYGYHAPTIYFPLLFHESLMIEPTETESLETLDEFIAVMRKIATEAIADPELVKGAPHHTPVARPDDTQGALEPKLTYADL